MNLLTYEAFKTQWFNEINKIHSPTDKSKSFCHKLFTQWRDLSDTNDELIDWPNAQSNCIDYIFLEDLSQEGENSSTILYLVQSKYAVRSSDVSSIISDGEKAIRAIASQLDEMLINNYILKDFTKDSKLITDKFSRIILVLATENTLTQTERNQLDSLRSIGNSLFNDIFDVECISLETIYANTIDDSVSFLTNIKINLSGNLTSSGENVLVGYVTLPKIYEFLKLYRAHTGDLDQLYEKNVRRFLGTRRRINRQMRETLTSDPAQFGLYNNGITLVVKDFEPVDSGYILQEPYIVNGCQTTRTIWDVFSQRYDLTGRNIAVLEKWKASAENGIVVVKIVRVGSSGENLLANITRYTNSQNSVSEKDFITLDKDFQALKQSMATKYDIFLEIQRGGWDSQLAYQAQNPDTKQFCLHANAFDLLKVYGAGWLREAGTAFGRNMSFVPGGKIYKQIIEDDSNNFDVDDLHAAYCLESAADRNFFGRYSKKNTRRLTRLLFYLIIVDLLKDVMLRNNMAITNKSITFSINKLAADREAFDILVDCAISVVDEYMTQGEEDSVFNEPEFIDRFNKNINGYLKWNKLGEPTASPKLHDLLAINKRTMGRGLPSPRDIISNKIK